MIRFLRIFWSSLTGLFKDKIVVGDELNSSFTVLPLEGDFSLTHSNYVVISDVARWEYIARTGHLKTIIKEKLVPVISEQEFKYIRSIPFLARYEVKTRLYSTDDKKFTFIHEFFHNGKIKATAQVKLCLLKNRKVVPPKEVIGSVEIRP